MKTVLSKYSNDGHSFGSKGKIIIWYFINRLFLNTNIPYPTIFKKFLLTLFGAKIGVGVVIKPKVNIKYPWLLEVGDFVWIGEQVWIDNLAKVNIGDNVCISQGAMLLCGNHNYKKATFNLIIGKIILEEGSWVGAKSTVCPGVTLGSHSILAVSSVANTDLTSYSIYQGNPAVKIRDRVIEG